MNKSWFTRFEQDHVDPQYLKNMEDATHYFQSWFSGRHEARFCDMLMSMHKLVSAGGYTGFTNTDGPYVATTSQFRGVTKDSWRPLLKKGWFKGLPNTEKIVPVFRAERLTGTLHLVNLPTGYELHLPHEDHVFAFLSEMQDCMFVLRDTFCAELLANYIQYFVAGHPFERINFSICMAQVNAILYHYGWEPLHHEYFDFDCFAYDYGRLETKFLTRLKRR